MDEALTAVDRGLAIAASVKRDVAQFHALAVKAGVMSEQRDFAKAQAIVDDAERLTRQLQAGTYDAPGLKLRQAEIA